jgi:dephospho-CoA kinase
VRLVSLTGGIGSGKSSVSERLAARGARIIDADEVVKQLQAPGQPVFNAMVRRWGEGIVGEDGTLDRPAVAAMVFGDPKELKALNAMVHPEVVAEMRSQADAVSTWSGVVVFDIPLLVEGDPDQWGASAVIVVDCPTEIATERLVTYRGFDRADVEARMSKQATRSERLAIADFVIDNGGDEAHLDNEVERCWAWLEGLPPTSWRPPERPAEDGQG